MVNINYKIVTNDNIDFLDGLCNQLMKFQAKHAMIRADIMASMSYDTCTDFHDRGLFFLL